MTVTTGRGCTWYEIEVGEVFAWNGCWVVSIKIDDYGCFGLADDCGDILSSAGNSWKGPYSNLYKLPKSVQALWKEE